MKKFEDAFNKLLEETLIEANGDVGKVSDISATLLSTSADLMYYIVGGHLELLDAMVMQSEYYMRQRIEFIDTKYKGVFERKF